MTPLTDEEKRAVVEGYRLLQAATDGELNERVAHFTTVYRGDLQTYLSDFQRASDKGKWVAELGTRLQNEIEPEFWVSSESTD